MNGVLHQDSYPAASFATVPMNINNLGEIIGQYDAFTGSFIYSNGTFQEVTFPQGSNTVAAGLNDLGDIVGSYFAGRSRRGFLLSKGTFSQIDFPGALSTEPSGINDNGQIVGAYVHQGVYQSFLLSDGVFSTIDVPGVGSYAYDINDLGQIVGGALGPDQAFVLSDGRLMSFSAPGANETGATGINNSGQIVGYYRDPSLFHGFIATPEPIPELGTFSTLITGLLMCSVLRLCAKDADKQKDEGALAVNQ